MSALKPLEVERLCLRLEPRLASGYGVAAEPAGELWELRFARAGRRHRLRLDPFYLEECLGRGECRHLRELLGEVCEFLEAK